MRRVSLALLAAIAAGPFFAWTSPQADTLAGQWEGQLLSLARPYRIVVAFEAAAEGGSRKGTMNLLGRNAVPLEDVSFEPPRIRFTVQVPQGKLVFDGQVKGDEIAGRVPWRGGEPVEFALARVPELKAPANREEAWQQDLDSALRLAVFDRSFTPVAREQYRKAIADLRARSGKLDDRQMYVEIARAVALANNGHTGAFTSRPQRRYPIRLFWFRDGLYVIRAASEHGDLVGCRVTGVGKLSTEAVLKRTSELIGGNEHVKRYRSLGHFVNAEVLYGLGVFTETEMENAEYTFQCNEGVRRVKLKPTEPPDRGVDFWRNLAPNWPTGTEDWAMALPRSAELPRYLRRAQEFYWFEFLKDSGVLYFQFNQSLNAPSGDSVAAFGEKLLGALDELPVKALVVDVRFNTGGNLMISRSLIDKIQSSEKLKGKNRLFVITTGVTFSAAIFHAAQIRANPDAVFVGEPVGDFLDFWAEGDTLQLPNSRINFRFSNGYHSYSTADPLELRPYYMDLSIQGLGPDVKVSQTFAEYVAGRDPALEAILARLK